jgi:hypothetical protein
MNSYLPMKPVFSMSASYKKWLHCFGKTLTHQRLE